MPEYTVAAACSVVLVVLAELWWLRTGLFTSAQYWLAMAIVAFFMVLVDGVLTDLDAPVVVYHPRAITGLRWPADIPVEDFLFGFSLVTAVLLAWRAQAPGESRDGAS